MQRALTAPLDAQRRADCRTAAASDDWPTARDVLDLLQLPERVRARIETS